MSQLHILALPAPPAATPAGSPPHTPELPLLQRQVHRQLRHSTAQLVQVFGLPHQLQQARREVDHHAAAAAGAAAARCVGIAAGAVRRVVRRRLATQQRLLQAGCDSGIHRGAPLHG